MRAALLLMLFLLALCGSLARGDDEAIVVELEWVSGRPAAYYEHAARHSEQSDTDQEREGVRIPFGQGAMLLIDEVFRDNEARYVLDRNFDGNLDDEKVVDFAFLPFEFSGSPSVDDLDLSRFATETVHPPWAKAAGLEDGVRVYLRLGDLRNDTDNLSATALLHRRGRVVIGGRERLVALYDGNGDFHFDHPTEDFLFLDVDGDRSIPRTDPSHERLTPGEPFRVRGAGYVATVEGAFGHVLRLERNDALPAKPRAWKQEPAPPTGVQQEGEARPLEELLRLYREKKAEIKRSRMPPALLQELVLEIGRTGRTEAFAFLQTVHKEKTSSVVRIAAVQAMGDARYVDCAGRLARIAAKERDARVCAAAIEALHRMDAPDRLRTLAKLARSTKLAPVHKAAVDHIGYLGTPEAHAVLTGLLKRCSRKPAYAHDAYFAATRYFAEPPSRELVALGVESGGPRLQVLALGDAKQLAHPHARDLALACRKSAREAIQVRRAVVEILAATGDATSVEALFELAPSFTPGERSRVVRLLQPTRDPEAVELVRRAIPAKEAKVRALAAEVAAGLPDPSLGKVAADRLKKEKDEDARLALVRAAGAHRAAGAIPTLLVALRSEKTGEALQEAALDALLRIGFDHEEVTDYLLGIATTAPWDVRLRLMDSAAESGSRGAVPILLKGLDAESWQIRLAAVKGLTQLRVKASLEALIERLAIEQKGRVHRALAAALFHVTGQNLYDDVDVWRQWWTEKGAAFEVPAEVPERPESDRDGTYGTFYGVPVDAEHVIFVIDQSGSMDSSGFSSSEDDDSRSDFQRAVAETRNVLERLPDGAHVNVIFFESDVRPWKKGLVELTGATRKDLDEFLGKQSPMGATNLYDALEMALKTPDVETIYLLSDGMPTAGKHEDTYAILDAAAALNWKNRAVIHTVALGFDSDLLQALAEQSDGRYVQR